MTFKISTMIKKHGLKACVQGYYDVDYGGYGGWGWCLDNGHHYNTGNAMIDQGRDYIESRVKTTAERRTLALMIIKGDEPCALCFQSIAEDDSAFCALCQ